MRRPFHIVGIVIAIACGGYFIAIGIENAQEIRDLRLSSSALMGFAVAVLLFVITMVSGGIAWHIALSATGEPSKPLAALTAVLLSQFAKYVPGNIAHVVGRVALARQYGFALPRVIVSMVFETGWVIIAAFVVAAAAVLIEGPRLWAALPRFPIEGIVLVVLAALVAPVAGTWVLGRWRPTWLLRLIGDADVVLPSVWPTLACVAIYCMGFSIGGAVLDLIAQYLLAAANSHYVLLTGVFAVAWVAGYIVPGAPGGLGVREAIQVAALGPIFGDGTAVALALIFRVCTVTADGVAFLIGLVLRQSIRR
jgi:uncharacterized membrane protein YbhN (UPF0104 family)